MGKFQVKERAEKIVDLLNASGGKGGTVKNLTCLIRTAAVHVHCADVGLG
jgi:hypothetical protein